MYVFSLILCSLTFCLIIFGGLVTSHDAGLAVPDWPLSYGQVNPPMLGGILWEHGHRVLASGIGFLTIILLVLVYVQKRPEHLKRFARILLGLVVLQGVFGGLTVIYLLPPAVSITHAALGQTFFSLTAVFSYLVLIENKGLPQVALEDQEKYAKFKKFMLVTFGIVFLQLIFGGIIRHTGSWAMLHVSFAIVVIVHLMIAVIKITQNFKKDKVLFRWAMFIVAATIFQVFIGIGALATTVARKPDTPASMGEVIMATGHQSTGALIIMTVLLLAVMAHHRAKPKAASSSDSGIQFTA